MDALTHAIEGLYALGLGGSDALRPVCRGAHRREPGPSRSTEGSDEARPPCSSQPFWPNFESHSDVAAVHCIAEALGACTICRTAYANAVCLPVVMEVQQGSREDRYCPARSAMNAAPRLSMPPAGPVTRSRFVRDSRPVDPPFRELGVPPAD